MGKVRTLKDPTPVARARALRAAKTEAEARLWSVLRNRGLGGWKWKRQVPRGPYIVDFLCADAALVIELDGDQHADQVAYDARRTAYLATLGLRVLRFWNHEIAANRDGVCATILHACEEARSLSPPAGSRR